MSVAVVIPNLNQGRYLGQAINSVMRQTYRPVQVIVVDGLSTDPQTADIRRLTSKIVTWISCPPMGMANARNVGILAAQAMVNAEYIVPLDADDWLMPTFIHQCRLKMQSDVGIVATGLVWPDGRIQWPVEPINSQTLLKENRLFTCSMFRTAAWEQAGGYDEHRETYEDWCLWLSIVQHGWRVEVVHEPLFHYRTHPESSSAKMKPGDHEKYVKYIREKHA